MSADRYPVILTYHSISEGDSPLKVSPALFAEQMEWLHANVRTAPLGEVVTALSERNPLPERTVVLTFDDGFRDFYSAAAPVLHRLGLPATIFVPTQYCGRTNGWPGQPSWVQEEALLNWREVSELARNGFSFGAHSLSHPILTNLHLAEAEREISGSKAQIEAHTGQPAEFFAYPYGHWNAVLRDLVGKHYEGACATAAGVVEPNADPLALPRVDVHYLRNPAWFRRLFSGSLVTYLLLRRLIRRLRGQPEGFYARR